MPSFFKPDLDDEKPVVASGQRKAGGFVSVRQRREREEEEAAAKRKHLKPETVAKPKDTSDVMGPLAKKSLVSLVAEAQVAEEKRREAAMNALQGGGSAQVPSGSPQSQHAVAPNPTGFVLPSFLREMHPDLVNHVRKCQSIEMTTYARAKPTNFIVRWDDLRLGSELITCLGESFSAPYPTPLQMNTIPAVLSGHNVVCAGPSGSGKSLAMLLPLVLSVALAEGRPFGRERCPVAIVVCPSREVVNQHSHMLRTLGRCVGNVFVSDRLSVGCDIALTTGMWFRDALEALPAEVHAALRFIVVDGADRILFPPPPSAHHTDPPKDNHVEAILSSMLQQPTTEQGPPLQLVLVGPSGLPGSAPLSAFVANSGRPFLLLDQSDRTPFVGCRLSVVMCMDSQLQTVVRQAASLPPPLLVICSSNDEAEEVAQSITSDGNVCVASRSVRLFASGEVGMLACSEGAVKGVALPKLASILCASVPRNPPRVLPTLSRKIPWDVRQKNEGRIVVVTDPKACHPNALSELMSFARAHKASIAPELQKF